jgi:hypothetical protein
LDFLCIPEIPFWIPLLRTGQNISKPYEPQLIEGPKKMAIITIEVSKIGLVTNEYNLPDLQEIYFLRVWDDDSLRVSKQIVPPHLAKRSKKLLPILWQKDIAHGDLITMGSL